jgi:gluconolactonase
MKSHCYFSLVSAAVCLGLAGCAEPNREPLSQSAKAGGLRTAVITPDLTRHATDAEIAPIRSYREPYPGFGKLEEHDPRFNELIEPGTPLEKLAEGFVWTEGPVWVPGSGDAAGYLLFNDIPANAMYRWDQGEGVRLFMHPSGYHGVSPRKGEPGCNGLTLDPQGRLVMCQHGNRRVARLAALDDPNGDQIPLATEYEGKRLNSPNDLCYHSNGDLYFTDPPYGLQERMNDPAKELDFQGVYRLGRDGELTLLTREITRPNGIAFSPDEQTLYVASSDPEQAVWWAFDVEEDGTLSGRRMFFDATPWVKEGRPGLPDGLKVDQQGNLFATGPGGVHVLAPDGTHLGTINTGQRTANCAWGNDGSTLYITADMFLARIRTRTKGNGW